MPKEGSKTFSVGGTSISGYTGASDLTTSSLQIRNTPFVLYAISTHTTGTPTITIEFSDDGTNWFTYKNQYQVPISETFFDGEFLPRYIRLDYVANSSDGNITFKIAEL